MNPPTSYNTWTGLKKERRDLTRWLDETNHNDITKTNLESIRILWNFLNSDNVNVRRLIP